MVVVLPFWNIAFFQGIGYGLWWQVGNNIKNYLWILLMLDFSYSFHPHYIKFLKTGIKVNMPCYDTLWCNNAEMCVIHGLESYADYNITFFSAKWIFTRCWGMKGDVWWAPEPIFRAGNILIMSYCFWVSRFSTDFLEMLGIKIKCSCSTHVCICWHHNHVIMSLILLVKSSKDSSLAYRH